MALAFMYAEEDPLMRESAYPYTAKNGSCQYVKSEGVGGDTGYKGVQAYHTDSLKAAIDKGPVSVAIEADKGVFQMYHSGILDSRECGHNLDHGVLAVGYGEGYFLVKNSWGASWGDQGYIKISDNQSIDVCGILMAPVYPTE